MLHQANIIARYRMASVFDNPTAKNKCQIFTPTTTVIQMLDNINYKSDLYGKKILDHSCGDGQFLKEVVRRYIYFCKQKAFSIDQIRIGLSQDIWGSELDKQHFDNCVAALNSITKEFGIENVKWKIFNCDSLRNSIDVQFDYIVGNPPYLSYWDIPKSEREFIRNKYDSCKSGAYDYCFAFIEDALSLLNKGGVLIYIIPSSIFKTKAGKALRDKIKPFIREIYDYKNQKVFNNALTSSAIIVLDKSKESEILLYHDITVDSSIPIDKVNLKNTWVFRPKNENEPVLEHRFGDYFKVSSSVATQCNKAFVLVNWKDDEVWLTGPNGELIEKKATWKAASPKGQITRQTERIIFPYYFENGDRRRYTESEYKTLFPFAYDYLLKSKEKLLERDSDKKAMWFEYGRSQALGHLLQPKILISSVVTNSVNIFTLTEAQIPYAGLYIVPIKNLSIDDGMKILKSDAFQNYIESIGVNVNGNSLRITAENIRNYYW